MGCYVQVYPCPVVTGTPLPPPKQGSCSVNNPLQDESYEMEVSSLHMYGTAQSLVPLNQPPPASDEGSGTGHVPMPLPKCTMQKGPRPAEAQPAPTSWVPMSVFTQPG